MIDSERISELARCDREIERCKQEALSGNPDIHGILLGLHDWRTEKKLIEGENMPRNEIMIDTTIGMIRDELARAMELWPPMQSAHEGYAVILEEMEELWFHVKTNQKRRDIEQMREEAVQLAAMAARFVADLTLGDNLPK